MQSNHRHQALDLAASSAPPSEPKDYSDGSISPRCLHQLSFGQHSARRANECFKKPQALAAYGYWAAFAKQLSALGIKNKRAKGKLDRHACSVVRFAEFRNFSARDLGLFGTPNRILYDTKRKPHRGFSQAAKERAPCLSKALFHGTSNRR